MIYSSSKVAKVSDDWESDDKNDSELDVEEGIAKT